jgi:hypothetical protein
MLKGLTKEEKRVIFGISFAVAVRMLGLFFSSFGAHYSLFTFLSFGFLVLTFGSKGYKIFL